MAAHPPPPRALVLPSVTVRGMASRALCWWLLIKAFDWSHFSTCRQAKHQPLPKRVGLDVLRERVIIVIKKNYRRHTWAWQGIGTEKMHHIGRSFM